MPSTASLTTPEGSNEIVLALAMAVVIWLVHRRLRRPGMLLWTVIGLYGAGRFLMFFYRSDSDDLALGLNGTQWVSAGLILAAVLGAWWTASRPGVGGLRKHSVGGFSAILLVLGAAALAAAGCGEGEPRAGEAGAPADVPVVEDAGRTWKPVSLLGKRDFHALEAVGRRIYGFSSDFRTREEGFLVSDDGGRSWRERRAPGSLFTLAAARSDPDELIAGGARGVHRSQDAGRSWRRVVAGPALAARLDSRRLVAIRGDGLVRAGFEDRGGLDRVGSIGGRPAALESVGDELYVAFHDRNDQALRGRRALVAGAITALALRCPPRRAGPEGR